MSRYSEQVRDEYGRVVPDVSVYVYVWDSDAETAGALEILTNDAALPLSNPLTTDEFGQFYFNSASGQKLLEFHYGGKLQYREQITVGTLAIPVQAAAQQNSEAASVVDLRTDFNKLLADLRAASIMATPAATGVFFDSTAGDTFTGSKISVPVDATLTTSASRVAFNSATAKSLDAKLKRLDASILKFAFDEFTVDCSFIVNSFPDVASFDIAAFFGVTDDALGNYCGSLRAANPSTSLKNELYSANTIALTEGGTQAFSLGDVVRCQYNRKLDITTVTWSYPSAADHVLTYTQVFTAGINEMNRSFITPFIRFIQANIVLTRLVVSVAHPGPKFAFVGDSIVKGFGTSTYTNGFASRIRAVYPGQTVVCGASGTATTDWIAQLQDVLALKPKYLFLMLGTNDNLGGDMAGTKTRYTALVNQIIAAGVIPITLAILPKNEVWQAIFNTWLAAQGWRFIDTYTPMVGVGNAMNVSYTSDGVHPNDAGAVVLRNLITAYITAQGI